MSKAKVVEMTVKLKLSKTKRMKEKNERKFERENNGDAIREARGRTVTTKLIYNPLFPFPI